MYPVLIGLAIVIGIVWFIASAAIAIAKPIGITFLGWWSRVVNLSNLSIPVLQGR